MSDHHHASSPSDRDEVVERVHDHVRANPLAAYEQLGVEFTKSSGKNAVALCPLHQERSPSFHVALTGDMAGTWKCFGCGEGGDIFELIMRLENLSFPDAKERLARCLGIQTSEHRAGKVRSTRRPRSRSRHAGSQASSDQRPLECNDADVRRWHGQLLTNEDRLQWLMDKRGLHRQTIEDYELGLDEDGLYTIPARGQDGALVGVHRYKPAKYQSASERARTAKGDGTHDSLWLQVPGSRVTLWPLWRWPEDAETLVLCEGELDTLIARQHGFPAVTHTGGAATFKQEWAAQFDGYEVIIVYDNDGAGRQGSKRVADVLAGAGISVRIAELPEEVGEGGDVTDFFGMGHTAADFEALLSEAEVFTPNFPVSQYHPGGEGAEPRAAVDQIREAKLKSYQRKRRIAEVVREDLVERGRLCRDEHGHLYYFESEQRRLRPIDSPEFVAMLENVYGLNPTEVEHKYTLGHVCSWTRERGDSVTVRCLAHYDTTRHSLYVSRFDGSTYRLDGDVVSLIGNGDDGHLFLDNPDWEPYQYQDVPASAFWEAIPTQANFTRIGPGGLSREEQQAVFAAWLLSLLFRDLLPTTRPILLLAGPKGSTKTSSSRIALIWLWGTRADVTTIDPEREDAFIAAVCSNPIVWFDNVDERVRWLPNRLAVTASGSRITLRELYTTNEEVVYRPDCLLALTARTPEFRREDVADRLIPLTTERVGKNDWVADRELLGHILARRNEVWGAVLGVANRVVGKLKAEGLPATANHRLADWASLAPVIGEALGIGDEVRSALARLSGAQSSFALAEEPIYYSLKAWLENPNNHGRWLTTSELCHELDAMARAHNVSWPYHSARAFGQRLSHIIDNLGELISVERHPYGNTYRYAFGPRSE